MSRGRLREHTRGNEHRLAALDLPGVQKSEHGAGVLPAHEFGEILHGHVALEAQVDLTGTEDVPGLGLAVTAAKVPTSKRCVRMQVDGQPFSCIEQFDQEHGVDPESVQMALSQPGLRIGPDLVDEQRTV